MKHWTSHFLFLSIVAASTAATSTLAADEGRFDVQIFRPLAGPRDLVMVPKSEVIGHVSPVLGIYWDAAFNPLTLALGGTGETINAVGSRFTVTPMLGLGFFDWAELTMAVPFITWQTSDNLRALGTEGRVRSTPGLGDIRVSTKVAMPHFNRKNDVKSGFGLALSGNLNLPTGDELAFTSDGYLSGGASIIADYRFNMGLLLASNLGLWIRPEHQFAGVTIGDMVQLGLAAEMYIVQRWGLSVIGEVFGYSSLTSLPDSAAQVPAEALVGLRWQSKQGITITVGGSFGAACGFGAPAARIFNSITWQPKSSNEQKEINWILDPADPDPDHDNLHAPADECPKEPGPPENNGCPDRDRDSDGVIDRMDPCPNLAPGPDGVDGCPLARLEGDEIVTARPIEYWAGVGAISMDTKTILQAVLDVIRATPTIRELEVRVHTDARESGAEGLDLSFRRAMNAAQWLVNNNPDGARIAAEGYGHLQPAINDLDCLAPDEELSEICKLATRENRRTIFHVLRWGAPPSREIGGKNIASVLPHLTDLKGGGLLPLCKRGMDCVLPFKKSVLPNAKLLPDAKDAEGRLPASGSQALPTGSLLPDGDSVLPDGDSVLPDSEDVLPEGEDVTPADEDVKPEGEQ